MYNFENKHPVGQNDPLDGSKADPPAASFTLLNADATLCRASEQVRGESSW